MSLSRIGGRVVFFLICCRAILAQTEQGIKPFGDLAWDDSFTSVAQKIKAWPGITECKATYLFTKADLIPLHESLAIIKIPEQILGLQFEMAGKALGLGPKRPRFRDSHSGKEWEYFHAPNQIMIDASPRDD
jgi:hypothetical protein